MSDLSFVISKLAYKVEHRSPLTPLKDCNSAAQLLSERCCGTGKRAAGERIYLIRGIRCFRVLD